MEVVFVVPDYHVEYPPPCMDGWGLRFIVVSPDGLLLPCLLAHTLPGLSFGNVRERSVQELWAGSPGLEAFRGEGWMPEPCRSCARRTIDFGGCLVRAVTGGSLQPPRACGGLLDPHRPRPARPGTRDKRPAQSGMGRLVLRRFLRRRDRGAGRSPRAVRSRQRQVPGSCESSRTRR